MGLDYCPIKCKGVQEVSEEEYLNIYANGDIPDTSYYSVKADGEKIIHYDLSFLDSRRKNLAVHFKV